jgi:peptidyl-prolyl cis-trans isomerase D
MISTFRRYLEGWVARGFFLLMVIAFISWGVGDMLRLVGGGGTWVAKVAGTTLDANYVEPEYRRDLAAATRDLPSGQEPSAAQRRDVAEKTLQRLIAHVALTQELRDLRIAVPGSVLVETVHNLAPFKGPTGTFDKARFDALVRANGMTEAGFLDATRGDIASRQLMDAVTAGAHAPESEAAPIYAARYEKRSADIAEFPIASAPEPPMPDAAAARRWYDNHPDQYATPEYRRIKVIVISTGTLAPDVTVGDKDLEAAYVEHQADYTTIAKRSARVISTTDQAKAEALAKQWQAGADWPAMQAAAKDAGAAAIEQNDATEREFPDPDLAKAVFATPVNGISPPIKGALGWFVIQVTSAVDGGTKSFEEVKDKLRERVVTERALELAYDAANKIDQQLGNGASLDSLASRPGVAATTVTLDAHGRTEDGGVAPLPGEEEIRSAILTAAFEAQKGDPPRLVEVQTPSTGGSGYYALSVEDSTPAGEKPFETVRDAVNEDWRANERRRSAEVAATDMLKAVKDGKSFTDAASAAGVTPRLSPLVTRGEANPVMPREVQQVLFSLKKGEPTMVENTDGFLVATPVEIIAPDPAADQAGYEQLRAAVTRTIASDIAATFADAVRLRANPRINQANLDQIVGP